MKQITLLLLLLTIGLNLGAQTSVNFNFNHLYEGNNFLLNEVIETPNYNFKITRLQYYLSNFSIIHDGGSETFINDSYVLIDADNDIYTLNDVNGVSSVERIKFNYGVDAVANHEDPALYDPAHALAYKTPSMHWGWSGGYMFTVLEAVVDTDKDGQYDVGFDMMPVMDKYYTTIDLVLEDNVVNNSITFNVNVNIDTWLSNFSDYSSLGINHGVNDNLDKFNAAIVKLSVFSTASTLNTKINDIDENIFTVFDHEGLSLMQLSVDQNLVEYKIEFVDSSGRLVDVIKPENKTINLSEYIPEKGIYFIVLKNSKNEVLKTAKYLNK